MLHIDRKINNMEVIMYKAVILALAVVLVPAISFGAEHENGMITKKSHHSVKDTIKRLKDAIHDAKPVSIMAEVDHQKNAEKVDMKIRPTYLVVFGNPNLGTQLFTSQQTAGIDLPMKALIWEDADGQVWLTYNDPEWIAERHDIDDRDDVVKKMQGALDKLTDKAVGE